MIRSTRSKDAGAAVEIVLSWAREPASRALRSVNLSEAFRSEYGTANEKP